MELLENNPSLKEVKAKLALGNHAKHNMPVGEHISLLFPNKEHTLISGEIVENEIDFCFKVYPDDIWKIVMLHTTRQHKEFAQVFKDKMFQRSMGDVEIVSFDPITQVAVFSHRDKALHEILKYVKSQKSIR